MVGYGFRNLVYLDFCDYGPNHLLREMATLNEAEFLSGRSGVNDADQPSPAAYRRDGKFPGFVTNS